MGGYEVRGGERELMCVRDGGVVGWAVQEGKSHDRLDVVTDIVTLCAVRGCA